MNNISQILRILGKLLTFLLLLRRSDHIKDGHAHVHLVELCIHENAFQSMINYLLGVLVYILNNKTTV